MPDIMEAVGTNYDLDITNTSNYRDGTILFTTTGKKLLKKITFSPERILFIHKAKEHLNSKGFTNIDSYCVTKEGVPYMNLEESCFTVTNMVDGRECNFDSKPDLNSAVGMLAAMHRATNGFAPEKDAFAKSELGNLPINFQKRLSDMKKMKKFAIKGRGSFDYLFLDWVDYFYNLGEDALKKLNLSKYVRLVEQAKGNGNFCHHDYTHSNIILNDEKTYIINFDSCCMELKVYDLTNLLRRKMRKCNWDIKEARNIIEEYSSIEPLEEDEIDVLRIMLQFPQKFWRIANKYYNSRHGWAEKIYIAKLNEVIEEIEYHKNFIDNFEEIIPAKV
jgi:spore coat protein I